MYLNNYIIFRPGNNFLKHGNGSCHAKEKVRRRHCVRIEARFRKSGIEFHLNIQARARSSSVNTETGKGQKRTSRRQERDPFTGWMIAIHR